jgi:hypothetical protein
MKNDQESSSIESIYKLPRTRSILTVGVKSITHSLLRHATQDSES